MRIATNKNSTFFFCELLFAGALFCFVGAIAATICRHIVSLKPYLLYVLLSQSYALRTTSCHSHVFFFFCPSPKLLIFSLFFLLLFSFQTSHRSDKKETCRFRRNPHSSNWRATCRVCRTQSQKLTYSVRKESEER